MTGKNEGASKGIHHVAMKVCDLDRSVKFYTQGLGFIQGISWGEGAGRTVMLDSGDGNCFEIFAGGTAGEKSEGAFLHVALRTDDCDKALKRAVEFGAVVTMEPLDVDIKTDPVKKIRIAFCRGLDGEVLEFFQDR